MMSPGIILFLALFHLAIDWIGMIKYYFHPTKVNISRLRTLSRSRSQMELFILADYPSPFPWLINHQNPWHVWSIRLEVELTVWEWPLSISKWTVHFDPKISSNFTIENDWLFCNWDFLYLFIWYYLIWLFVLFNMVVFHRPASVFWSYIFSIHLDDRLFWKLKASHLTSWSDPKSCTYGRLLHSWPMFWLVGLIEISVRSAMILEYGQSVIRFQASLFAKARKG